MIALRLINAVAAITTAGAGLVTPDLAAQRAFDPAWPSHAKFHDARYRVMTVLLGWPSRYGPAGERLHRPGHPGARHDRYAPDLELTGRTVFVLGLRGQGLMAIVLLVATAATLRTPVPSAGKSDR